MRSALDCLLVERYPEWGVYAADSVDSPSEAQFMTVRWNTKTRAFGAHGPALVTVTLNRRERDYAPIDAVISDLVEWLPELTHVPGDDGWTVTCFEWNATGPDLFDDGFDTISKTLDLTVVARLG